jgi:hypothetical protein
LFRELEIFWKAIEVPAYRLVQGAGRNLVKHG